MTTLTPDQQFTYELLLMEKEEDEAELRKHVGYFHTEVANCRVCGQFTSNELYWDVFCCLKCVAAGVDHKAWAGVNEEWCQLNCSGGNDPKGFYVEWGYYSAHAEECPFFVRKGFYG